MVSLTDLPDMTTAVYRDVKQQHQYTNLETHFENLCKQCNPVQMLQNAVSDQGQHYLLTEILCKIQ